MHSATSPAGFCFLNNSAIAAETFLRAGMRPAILDVDVHHGNGTQGIFYNRRDVLTVSIHADPIRFYPFFWGHADERGAGEGIGYNLTCHCRAAPTMPPIWARSTLQLRVSGIRGGCRCRRLGLDAHENDPFKGFKVTTTGFARIAESIAVLGLPALIVQEGGYLQPDLGANLVEFPDGLSADVTVVAELSRRPPCVTAAQRSPSTNSHQT